MIKIFKTPHRWVIHHYKGHKFPTKKPVEFIREPGVLRISMLRNVTRWWRTIANIRLLVICYFGRGSIEFFCPYIKISREVNSENVLSKKLTRIALLEVLGWISSNFLNRFSAMSNTAIKGEMWFMPPQNHLYLFIEEVITDFM